MIFANEDHLNKTFPDVAGSEYFCFGLLTLAFIRWAIHLLVHTLPLHHIH